MTLSVFNMANKLQAVDPMVLALSAAVENVLPKEAKMKFDICVIEALTNIVEHAQTSDVEQAINIHLTSDEEGVSVEIFDPVGASAFDLREHASDLSSIDVMAESGRGLALIRNCADRVEYGAVNGRNRLSMSFANAT